MWRSVIEKRRSDYAIEHGQPGDVIVLAGKGHEDYQEISGVKHPMDERDPDQRSSGRTRKIEEKVECRFMFADIIVDINMKNWIRSFNTESLPVWQGNFCWYGSFLFLSANGTGRRKDTSLVFRKPVIMICQSKRDRGYFRDGIAIEGKLVALAAWMKRAVRRHDDPGAENRTSDQTERERENEKADPAAA